jgi:hypothetical protein
MNPASKRPWPILTASSAREMSVVQVLYIGDVQAVPARVLTRCAPLAQELGASARSGDSQRDQIHVEPPRKILVDKFGVA